MAAKGVAAEQTEAPVRRPNPRLIPLPLRVYWDAALVMRAREITTFGPSVEALAQELTQQMFEFGGVGLSAPQLGISQRMMVVRDLESEQQGGQAGAFCFCNPRLIERSEQTQVDGEGCLSLPGLKVAVERHVEIALEAQDVYGEPLGRVELNMLLARVAQHELDHLDGVLLLDHLPPARRRVAIAELAGSGISSLARAS